MAKQTTYFWVGKFKTESLLHEFLEENYDDNDDAPISKFAESQGETWIDHDFLEAGFEMEDESLKEKFAKYSYGEHWFDELEKRITEKGLNDVNTLIMLSGDEGESPVESPESFSGDGFEMEYLGNITYEYH